jgi:hypothetical protein
MTVSKKSIKLMGFTRVWAKSRPIDPPINSKSFKASSQKYEHSMNHSARAPRGQEDSIPNASSIEKQLRKQTQHLSKEKKHLSKVYICYKSFVNWGVFSCVYPIKACNECIHDQLFNVLYYIVYLQSRSNPIILFREIQKETFRIL